MNTKTKYVVFQNGAIDSMIVFGSELVHSTIAEKLNKPIISAGFLTFGIDVNGNHAVFAVGESQSLGVASRVKRDTQLARHLFELGG